MKRKGTHIDMKKLHPFSPGKSRSRFSISNCTKTFTPPRSRQFLSQITHCPRKSKLFWFNKTHIIENCTGYLFMIASGCTFNWPDKLRSFISESELVDAQDIISRHVDAISFEQSTLGACFVCTVTHD